MHQFRTVGRTLSIHHLQLCGEHLSLHNVVKLNVVGIHPHVAKVYGETYGIVGQLSYHPSLEHKKLGVFSCIGVHLHVFAESAQYAGIIDHRYLATFARRDVAACVTCLGTPARRMHLFNMQRLIALVGEPKHHCVWFLEKYLTRLDNLRICHKTRLGKYRSCRQYSAQKEYFSNHITGKVTNKREKYKIKPTLILFFLTTVWLETIPHSYFNVLNTASIWRTRSRLSVEGE